MKKNSLALFIFPMILLCSCVSNDPTNFVTYHCEETRAGLAPRTYLIDLYRTKADTNTYLISNFHNLSTEGLYDVTIKVSNKKISFIPTPQQIGSSQYKINSGSGTVDTNANFGQMKLDYTIWDGTTEIAVHTTYTK